MKGIKNNGFGMQRDPDSTIVTKLRNSDIENKPKEIFISPQELSNESRRTKGKQSPSNRKIFKFLTEEEQGDIIIQHKRHPTNESSQLRLQAQRDEEYDKNIECIVQKMREIHNRLENDILYEDGDGDGDGQRRMFKIFSNVVTTKKDIERLGKERRFMRSQLSQHYRYEEPKIDTQLIISRRERALTEVYEEKELRMRAQEFTLKVKQEKEVLLGMQFVRRKMQLKRRQMEHKKERDKIDLIKQLRLKQKPKSQEKRQLFSNSRVLKRNLIQKEQDNSINNISALAEGYCELKRFETEPIQIKLNLNEEKKTPQIMRRSSQTEKRLSASGDGRLEDSLSLSEVKRFGEKSKRNRNGVYSKFKASKDSGRGIDVIVVSLKPTKIISNNRKN